MANNLQKGLGVVGVFAVIAVAGIADNINNGPSTTDNPTTVEQTGYANLEVKVAESQTGITATKSGDWAEAFPNQYSTFAMNSQNDEIVDYLEESPYLTTLYDGYGFAISYGSARGHSYVIDDLYETGRPHKLANCFTCKSSDFTAKVLSEGDSVYAMDFEAVKAEIQDPFGCFHCHANEPGSQIYVTHGYLADALGDDITSVPAADLSCAQCHTEYYFDPETKTTTLGYTSLDTMTPTKILEYENSIVNTDGDQFYDWIDASTGVAKLKAQHPEFETYFGAGSVHTSMGLTCADCHMERTTAEDGTTFTSHYWTSPLNNEETMNDTCAKCHDTSSLVTMVQTIQANTRAREDEIGLKIAELDEKLTDAIANNTLSEDDLATIRSLYRDGQFLWDFVYVENAEGAHNTTLTNETLDAAEDLIDQALEMLK